MFLLKEKRSTVFLHAIVEFRVCTPNSYFSLLTACIRIQISILRSGNQLKSHQKPLVAAFV